MAQQIGIEFRPGEGILVRSLDRCEIHIPSPVSNFGEEPIRLPQKITVEITVKLTTEELKALVDAIVEAKHEAA